MKQRCTNEKIKSYPHYGGRGIEVCAEWTDSFHAFFSDMKSRPTKKHSLDRIDVHGNYTFQNCRWATTKQQAANRRDTTKYLFRGEMMALSHIAEESGIPQSTMYRFVRLKGLFIEEAISKRQ